MTAQASSLRLHCRRPDIGPHPLLECLNYESAEAPARFHASLPGYAPTALHELASLARALGLGRLWLKDESGRFGLNAFKALGGSYTIARLLAAELGLDEQEMRFSALTSADAREKLGRRVFVTATDGNHGRGVAWSARMLGHDARVFLPAGTATARVRAIEEEGGHPVVTDLAYDDAVRLAGAKAREHGWLLVQDTSWPGYEAVPLDIMRGYTTMARETVPLLRGHEPTHVFLQAGVGSFAAALAACLCSVWPALRVIIVEPLAADCLYRTATADDGRLHAVDGPMRSMMAGLCCGEPSMQAWEVLRRRAVAFAVCSEEAAVKGMRALAYPEGDDARVIAGESGAAGLGALLQLMTEPALAAGRAELKLNAASRVLLVSTEGATDPENYLRVTGLDARYAV